MRQIPMTATEVAEVKRVLAAGGGIVWLVRPGGHYHYMGFGDGPAGKGRPCFSADCPPHLGDIAGRVPPAVFVAASQPCGTCHGTGTVYVRNGLNEWDPEDCTHPDCRIELVGPCPRDHQDGSLYDHAVPIARGCTGSVTVAHGYTVGQPTPIVRPALRSTARHIGVFPSSPNYPHPGAILYEFDRVGGKLIASPEVLTDDLAHYGDPTGLVGQWALRVEVEA